MVPCCVTPPQPKGGDGDGAKRAWARAATQRVLDLMLVTERVRQEEQKRRVAAARASNQVTNTASGGDFAGEKRKEHVSRGFRHAPNV